jgi:hypothetical protein
LLMRVQKFKTTQSLATKMLFRPGSFIKYSILKIIQIILSKIQRYSKSQYLLNCGIDFADIKSESETYFDVYEISTDS